MSIFATAKLLLISSILIILFSCKSPNTAIVSEIPQEDTLALYPYWIDMMSDSNVNYYEVVNAFDTYWENRIPPTEKDGEAQDIFDKDKTPEQEANENARTTEFVFEYKKFLNWKQTNKNLVKPDGTIMSDQEVLEQWKQQQQERQR
jgi:hypothetical protein|tara:strand:- start:9442 stop:9882 length:441 start_codon:yes stop_codon:yes gene_type:complete